MKKIILNIFLILFILITFNNCGKKGELEQSKNKKNYPREYPSE